MGDGYNFEQLKREILSRSTATDWEVARKEWSVTSIIEADEPETCLCGHQPIIELCSIKNKTTGIEVDVGNVCVKRFFGFRTDLIFQQIKRIRKDITKALGSDATAFFYHRRVLTTWEYNFQQDTYKKRNLTYAQLSTRIDINEKVLRTMKRRGLS